MSKLFVHSYRFCNSHRSWKLLLSYCSSHNKPCLFAERLPLHPWVYEMDSFFSLTMVTSISANSSFSQKPNNGMANRVDPDERARYEPSHLDLHCLQRYMYWSVEIKGLRKMLHWQGNAFVDFVDLTMAIGDGFTFVWANSLRNTLMGFSPQ